MDLAEKICEGVQVLPSRAYAEPVPAASSTPGAHTPPTDSRPALIVAVGPHDLERFPATPYARHSARTTIEAVRLIERWRPRLVAVDWDVPEIDHIAVCSAAKQGAPVGILAVMGDARRAPSALKAGCHAILLKPFPLNLVSARLGRIYREIPAATAASLLGATLQQWGTNRVWPDVHCPQCSEGNAVCFEYSSHRRSWYACLKCEHVWIGPRRE